nr:Chain A, lasso peptide [Streptomyces sp.]
LVVIVQADWNAPGFF